MLLNFQRQFAKRVRAGEKRQTIRAAGQRKDRPKVGDTAHCYTGLRTRNTEKLGSWPIERVDVIRMTITEDDTLDEVILGGERLTRAQQNELAIADGFQDLSAMEKWFAGAHGPQEFYGWVIGWAWSPDAARVRTCHPDNKPPNPCPRKFALSECRTASGVEGKAK